MSTFVLIPGAGTDPRVYGQTINALRTLGHDGVAPELPLTVGDAHPVTMQGRSLMRSEAETT